MVNPPGGFTTICRAPGRCGSAVCAQSLRAFDCLLIRLWIRNDLVTVLLPVLPQKVCRIVDADSVVKVQDDSSRSDVCNSDPSAEAVFHGNNDSRSALGVAPLMCAG